MLAISEKYIGSLCEIKTVENKLLSTGFIDQVTDDYVEIKYRDDVKLLLTPNIFVKVSVFNEKLGFKVLVGKVYVGTNDFIRIVEIISLMDFEKRDFFRINIYEHATLYIKPITVEETHYTKDPAIAVCLSNISLCGVYFKSIERFRQGDKLYLLLELSSGKVIFPCIVHRICEEDDDVLGYGCEFIDYSQKQSDDLYRFIYEKQVEFLKIGQEK